MNIEARLHTPNADAYIERAVALLGESCTELLVTCADSLDCVTDWLERINTERFAWGRAKTKPAEPVKSVADALVSLEECLQSFRTSKRSEQKHMPCSRY